MGPREREHIFWSACIVLRSFLAAVAYLARAEGARGVEFAVAAYLCAWAAALLHNSAYQLWVERYRAADERRLARVSTGNFGGAVWWKWYRFVHAAAYLGYACAVAADSRLAPFVLVGDVAFAVGVGVHRYALAGRE